MLLIFIYVLIFALLISGKYRDPEVRSGRQSESGGRPPDAAISRPWHQPPGSWSARLPQLRTVNTSGEHSARSGVRPGELTSTEIPTWTALDDHQLTRLLKQSSP